jgi:PAS domain-containing protein
MFAKSVHSSFATVEAKPSDAELELLNRCAQAEARAEAAERLLAERLGELEKQRRLDEQVARFEEIMRLYFNQDIQSFCDAVANELAQLVEPLQIAIYLLEGIDISAGLVLAGGYGCGPTTGGKNKFLLGEGLIGQAARSERTFYLHSPTDALARIESAIGSLPAHTVAVVPLNFNKKVQGVLEILSHAPLSADHLQLLEKLAKNLGASLESLSNRKRMELLYEEAQLNLQKTLAQEEEMRQNLEEMEATQEELKRIQAELQSTSDLSNLTIESTETVVIATNEYGDVLVWNQKASQALGYSESEVKKGLAITRLLSRMGVDREREKLRQMYNETPETSWDVVSYLPRREKAYRRTWTLIGKNDRPVEVDVVVSALKKGVSFLGIVLVGIIIE